MKEDIAKLYMFVFKNKYEPKAIKVYNRMLANYTNVAITFTLLPSGATLTHYIHIYR